MGINEKKRHELSVNILRDKILIFILTYVMVLLNVLDEPRPMLNSVIACGAYLMFIVIATLAERYRLKHGRLKWWTLLGVPFLVIYVYFVTLVLSSHPIILVVKLILGVVIIGVNKRLQKMLKDYKDLNEEDNK